MIHKLQWSHIIDYNHIAMEPLCQLQSQYKGATISTTLTLQWSHNIVAMEPQYRLHSHCNGAPTTITLINTTASDTQTKTPMEQHYQLQSQCNEATLPTKITLQMIHNKYYIHITTETLPTTVTMLRSHTITHISDIIPRFKRTTVSAACNHELQWSNGHKLQMDTIFMTIVYHQMMSPVLSQ